MLAGATIVINKDKKNKTSTGFKLSSLNNDLIFCQVNK
jgi:hypothetical protein